LSAQAANASAIGFDWSRTLLVSPVGRSSVDDLLDGIELADAIERFFGDGAADGDVDIEEFAPHMRPAASLDNPITDEQLIEPSVAIGVNDAAEVLLMLAFAVG
jgi:hypothetical protein